MRRTKTGRQPRGVLLVPVFKGAEARGTAEARGGRPEDGQPEDAGVVEDTAVADTAAGEPALEEEHVAAERTDDGSTEAWLPR